MTSRAACNVCCCRLQLPALALGAAAVLVLAGPPQQQLPVFQAPQLLVPSHEVEVELTQLWHRMTTRLLSRRSGNMLISLPSTPASSGGTPAAAPPVTAASRAHRLFQRSASMTDDQKFNALWQHSFKPLLVDCAHLLTRQQRHDAGSSSSGGHKVPPTVTRLAVSRSSGSADGPGGCSSSGQVGCSSSGGTGGSSGIGRGDSAIDSLPSSVVAAATTQAEVDHLLCQLVSYFGRHGLVATARFLLDHVYSPVGGAAASASPFNNCTATPTAAATTGGARRGGSGRSSYSDGMSADAAVATAGSADATAEVLEVGTMPMLAREISADGDKKSSCEGAIYATTSNVAAATAACSWQHSTATQCSSRAGCSSSNSGSCAADAPLLRAVAYGFPDAAQERRYVFYLGTHAAWSDLLGCMFHAALLLRLAAALPVLRWQHAMSVWLFIASKMLPCGVLLPFG